MENNVPIMSATQTTRGGYANSDIGWKIRQNLLVYYIYSWTHVLTLISTEDLESLNQLMVKQLKNRYNDFPGMNKRFVVGIDRARMKLYDCEQEAQDDIIDSGRNR